MPLPERCYATLPSDKDQVIVIKRGEKGHFYKTDIRGNEYISGEQLAKELNDRIGVTEREAECMLIGSIFGWDVPGAKAYPGADDGETKDA